MTSFIITPSAVLPFKLLSVSRPSTGHTRGDSKVLKSGNTTTGVFIPCVGGTYGDGNREAYFKVGVDV